MSTTNTPPAKPKKYPTDTTEEQWEIIKGLIPPKKGRGRNREYEMRRIIDAIFYISRSGCQWRMLPHDFPPWGRVWYYFSKWSKDGTLDAIHDALADKVREKDKPTERTTASVDSQTTDSAGAREDREFDGGKKLDGRKRHIIVDSLGLVLALGISAGNVADAVGGAACLDQMDPEDHPKIKTIFGDHAYEKLVTALDERATHTEVDPQIVMLLLMESRAVKHSIVPINDPSNEMASSPAVQLAC